MAELASRTRVPGHRPALLEEDAGLALAGLGIAVLYPVTLARLSAVPGLLARHSAALGALASAVAILAAPSLLAAVTSVVTLRVAFLLPGLILLTMLALAYRSAPPGRGGTCPPDGHQASSGRQAA